MSALNTKPGLTDLMRLAERRPEEAWMLERALRGRLNSLAAVALEVGAETGDPIGRIVASLLSTKPDAALAERLFRLLPPESVALREVAVEVNRQCLEHWRRQADDAMVAMHATNLANRLSEVGRRKEALAAAEQAVDLYRALAEDKPDAFRPHLAGSLLTLANRLSKLGRHKEALAAVQEAVTIYRALAEARPDTFLPELAASLNNLAIKLSKLGRHEEALAAAEESVTVRRALADVHFDAFRSDLARSLHTLANRLIELGRHGEALAAVQEAVTIYRALAEARPDAFFPELAASLNSLAITLSKLGQHGEAFAVAEEAATLLFPPTTTIGVTH